MVADGCERCHKADAELVRRVAAGDRDGLDAVYRAHAAAVLVVARKVLRDASLAQDVVQDVFLRFWRQPQRYDARRGSLRTYLVTQASSRAVDLVRSAAARDRREMLGRAEGGGSTADPAGHVLRLDSERHLRNALDGLRAEERATIELAFFGGMTYRQVATILHLPEGTVKSRIRAGLRRLQVALAPVESERRSARTGGPFASGKDRSVAHAH